MEERIEKLEDRLNKIETTQALQSNALKNIEKKIDDIMDAIAKSDEKFQTKEHCDQLSIFETERLASLSKRIDTTEVEFKAHMKDHYNRTDRFATWLSTAMVGAFIIAKLANLI